MFHKLTCGNKKTPSIGQMVTMQAASLVTTCWKNLMY
jgi:hypothetical protein